MPFQVTFDDQPYPLPPELGPLPLDLLPGDQTPDQLALFEALGRLQRDISRLSGRLQLNIKSQAEALAKVEDAVQAIEDKLTEQSMRTPPGIQTVGGGGVEMHQLMPIFNQLNDQIKGVQQRIGPFADQLAQVKEGQKEKVEEGLFERIFPVLDSFERLFVSAEKVDDPKVVKWLEGVQMIRGQLLAFLRTQGVEEIEALGLPFDPKTFAAIGTEPTDAAPPNTIVRVGRTGYRRGSKILRVPEVFVSKPPTEEARVDAAKLSRHEQKELQRQEEAAPPQAAPPPVVAQPPPPPPVAAAPKPKPPSKPKPQPKADAPPTVDGWNVAAPEATPEKPAVPQIERPADDDEEDKFKAIRERAQAALEGLFEPEAHIESPSPVPLDPALPHNAPAQPAGAWGNIGSEAVAPEKPPELPPAEVGEPGTLVGGEEEYYANGDAVYTLRMESGLTLLEFWKRAFKAMDPDQVMDLGEQIEREEMGLERAELARLAKGLEMPLEELMERFRPE